MSTGAGLHAAAGEGSSATSSIVDGSIEASDAQGPPPPCHESTSTMTAPGTATIWRPMSPDSWTGSPNRPVEGSKRCTVTP